jgi:hypothetical protein
MARTFSTKGTAHAATHLIKVHKLTKPGGNDDKTAQMSIGAPRYVNGTVLRQVITQWVVDRRYSNNEVEAESFQAPCPISQPLCNQPRTKKWNTIRGDIIELFEESKAVIKQHLQVARSRIHLSFDLWTSPNYKAMLAIVGHWTSEGYTVKTSLMGIRQIEGRHNGENMAGIVFDIAREFEIIDKLGWFVTDNASSNDKALRLLDARIREEGGKGFNVAEQADSMFWSYHESSR